MNRQSKKRFFAALFCICFVIFSLLTAAFIITHADHDCVGHDCTVCAQIHTSANLLKQLGTAIACSAFAFAFAGLFAASNIFPPVILHIVFTTPVTLKVRMDN
ncbi:hypothetical protein [Lutispora saccharofermentans]|uniref:AraC family transcriptional regulator n=1 Tax=Lutispora saccharofermentans TaxID=3024236 RepID=A0ABT1NHX7_9FIRM|nr:hypothetical protein [Lutispora saccharofermentans]MCQ1530694.1 hypothetical protein [Lutispora saccharofermentans]